MNLKIKKFDGSLPKLQPNIQEELDRWVKKREDKKPLLYLAAHIKGYGKTKDELIQDRNDIVAGYLKEHFDVFVPQRNNPYGVFRKNSQGWEMAVFDEEIIRRAEVILAIGGFGKDTSWENGFAAALRNKLNIFYLPDRETIQYHIDDWMLLRSFEVIMLPKKLAPLLKGAPAIPPDVRIVPLEKEADFGLILHEIYLKYLECTEKQQRNRK